MGLSSINANSLFSSSVDGPSCLVILTSLLPRMMLNFYGLRLVDMKTGQVDRHDDWHDRFQNLNYCEHNFLRISKT